MEIHNLAFDPLKDGASWERLQSATLTHRVVEACASSWPAHLLHGLELCWVLLLVEYAALSAGPLQINTWWTVFFLTDVL